LRIAEIFIRKDVMSIIRTYFDKNNTIISGIRKSVNTGRNPVTELFYGDLISRFLFYVDFQALRNAIDDKTINPSRIIRHTLKMKNTNNFDVMPFRDNRDKIQFTDKNHAVSFDLELKPIYQYWDEGTGYDFELVTDYPDERALVNGYSNWINRTEQYLWATEGAVISGTTAVATQHFDKGNEDIEMDITAFVNTVMATGQTTSLCLKFTNFFEGAADIRKYVSYFTKHTNTFFEPFIETEYDDLVHDDRRNFVLDQNNGLVLYVFENGSLINLDSLPVCQINGTPFTVTQLSKGIYSAMVLLPSSSYIDYAMYHDVWSNIIIGGVSQPSVTMDITPRPSSQRYQIGATTFEPIPYGISISGIKRDENMVQGEKRKVLVHIRKPYTVAEEDVLKTAYYRMYVKQGVNQVPIIGWTEINSAFNTNYFFVDTSWLVPQQYFIDIKLVIREEVRLYNEETKFSVTNTL
jgi:hypothetical protein